MATFFISQYIFADTAISQDLPYGESKIPFDSEKIDRAKFLKYFDVEKADTFRIRDRNIRFYFRPGDDVEAQIASYLIVAEEREAEAARLKAQLDAERYERGLQILTRYLQCRADIIDPSKCTCDMHCYLHTGREIKSRLSDAIDGVAGHALAEKAREKLAQENAEKAEYAEAQRRIVEAAEAARKAEAEAAKKAEKETLDKFIAEHGTEIHRLMRNRGMLSDSAVMDLLRAIVWEPVDAEFRPWQKMDYRTVKGIYLDSEICAPDGLDYEDDRAEFDATTGFDGLPEAAFRELLRLESVHGKDAIGDIKEHLGSMAWHQTHNIVAYSCRLTLKYGAIKLSRRYELLAPTLTSQLGK